MTQLKPCPFCGGEASIYHGDSTDGYIKGTDYVMAFCGWCGASIREKKEDEVIKKWNTRPNPWHTGTPTTTSCLYLVLWYNTEDKVFQYSVLNWHDQLNCWYDEETPDSFWGDEYRAEVVAWMPFMPYRKGEVTNG